MINTIASERKLLGMTQQQLGEKMGRDRTAIARWEKNPMAIDGETLYKLSGIFHCSVDYLLGITDERTPRVTQ